VLSRVVQHAIETSRPVIDSGRHVLTVVEPSTPIFVDADTTRLAQVFSNLLNNAAKYTEPGGRITLSFSLQGGVAVVTVRDTGVGIPESMLPQVFEMFTQVDRSLERSQGGLGIGLTLVKRLVEMHDGAVEARSAGHGLGSEFEVRLPASGTPMVEPPVPGGADGSPAASRRRVLVADDNHDSALSLAMMLRLMGNDTATAHDGIQAIETAAAFRPDMILLDIGMPRLNGYDTARRIRGEAWGQGVVLVALTGWSQEEDRRLSQEAGFDLHLVKPVDPAILEKLLATLPSQSG
jgi:CheY-like chemotaxis protein